MMGCKQRALLIPFLCFFGLSFALLAPVKAETSDSASEQRISSVADSGEQMQDKSKKDKEGFFSYFVNKIIKTLDKENTKQDNCWFMYLFFVLLFMGFCLGYKTGFIEQLIFFLGFSTFPFLIEYIHSPVCTVLRKIGLNDDSIVPVVATLGIMVFFFVWLMFFKKILNIVLRVLLLRPLNNVIGGVCGLVLSSAGIGCCLMFLTSAGVSIDKEMVLYREMHVIAERVCGTEALDAIAQAGKQVASFVENSSESI